MKRSHALNQLALFLEECLEKDDFSYMETAEALLYYLDEIGMSPPMVSGNKILYKGWEVDDE